MENMSVGTRINRYEIVECIRKSELIGLYKAYDTKLERNVFLKLVLHGADYTRESVNTFLEEAKILAKLSHPNIVRVLDFGYDEKNLYIINEYTEGKALSDLIQPLMDWKRACQILLPVVEALSYAHSKGIIHRDLRPENIIVTEDDRPLLSDFSLMRIIEDEETRDMTGTNVGLGSPAYISPEQGKGLPVDFRSDIYSLGVVLFEMVTGQKPFQAGSSMEVVIQHVMKAPPRPSNLVPDLPSSVEQIILSCLVKDAEKRSQTMEQLAEALKAVLSPEKSPAARSFKLSARMIALVVLVTLVLIGGGFWIWKTAVRNASGTPRQTAPAGLSATETPVQAADTQAAPSTSAPVSTKTSAPTPTPNLAVKLASIPVLPGTKIPDSSQVISADNIGSVVELARLGTPRINQMLFIKGDQVLVGATSAGLYFYDANTLIPKYFLDTQGWLSSFAVSRDEGWIITGDMKGNVAIWDLYTGGKILSIAGDSSEITALDISPDKSLIAFTSQTAIKVWDVAQGKLLFETRKNGMRINKLYFLPDGSAFVTGGDDFQINVWDAKTGKLIRKMTASQKINDLSITKDGRTAAVALENSTIQIWNLTDGTLLNTIRYSGNVTPYTSLSFLPNNILILAGAEDGKARIWNVNTSDFMFIWETPARTTSSSTTSAVPVQTMAVSQDGSRAVVLADDGTLDLYDLSSQKLVTSRDMSYYDVKQVVISADGQKIVYQLGTSFVEVYSVPNQTKVSRIAGVLPVEVPISSDSSMLLIETNDLQLYSLSTSDTQQLFTYYDTPPNGLVNFVMADKIVAVASGRALQLWSTTSGRQIEPALLKNNGNCTVLYRINGNFLVAGSAVGVLGQSDNLDYFCHVTRNTRATTTTFLPDGSIVAFSAQYQTIEVWKSPSPQPQTITSSQPGDMLGVSVSKDGRLLAAASTSGVIEIYDLTTMKLLKSIDILTSPVNQVTFSSDQKYLITASADGTVRVWGVYP